MKSLKKPLLFVLALLFPMLASASWDEAKESTERSLTEMIAVIERYEGQTAEEQTALIQDIEPIVNRDVDFRYIANWVMGKYYRRASAQERDQFAEVFKQTLIKTYAKSLAGFDVKNYTILTPSAQSPDPDKQIVTVEVVSEQGQTYTLVNYMVKKSDEWKLVNVVLNGINLRITFKNQFANMMQTHKQNVQAVIDDWSSQIDVPKGQ